MYVEHFANDRTTGSWVQAVEEFHGTFVEWQRWWRKTFDLLKGVARVSRCHGIRVGGIKRG
jgi:hypothetical protein